VNEANTGSFKVKKKERAEGALLIKLESLKPLLLSHFAIWGKRLSLRVLKNL
jgi:hypothetical protein